MASKASIAGHPIHPMIISFPLALWTTSFVADVIFYFWRGPSLLVISKFCLRQDAWAPLRLHYQASLIGLRSRMIRLSE
ncbi:MAG: hypothetical protein H0U18_13555 [Pyrinomonadaceae bacterium]|jgi:uncharacterized membrane protein|nr:hypothetical protein [Pyrinomonadaceae bacterium]